MKVGSVQITVLSGDITDTHADVIVASCNKDLDLRKGRLNWFLFLFYNLLTDLALVLDDFD